MQNKTWTVPGHFREDLWIFPGEIPAKSGTILGIFLEHSGTCRGTVGTCWESLRFFERKLIKHIEKTTLGGLGAGGPQKAPQTQSNYPKS